MIRVSVSRYNAWLAEVSARDRGEQIASSELEFNANCKGEGIGFKTDVLKALMRVPGRKETHHSLFMEDTGAGKTHLIMQLMC